MRDLQSPSTSIYSGGCKNVRASVGATQAESASAFGISISTLCHWERGDGVKNNYQTSDLSVLLIRMIMIMIIM